MLVHPWDAGRPEDGFALAEAQGFGQLIAAGRGRPVPVGVPTQFLLDRRPGGQRPEPGAGTSGDGAQVLLHLARPNPVWAAIEEIPAVLLAVSGDWAYIPGAWKTVGDEDPAWGIPTTYHGAVHLTGTAHPVHDDEGKAAILRRQLAALEPVTGADLVDPARHGRRLAGIVGLRITVEQVVTKLKYGGNVDGAHRRRVAEALAQRDGPGDAAARSHIPHHPGDPDS